jgi:hypothetical protein
MAVPNRYERAKARLERGKARQAKRDALRKSSAPATATSTDPQYQRQQSANLQGKANGQVNINSSNITSAQSAAQSGYGTSPYGEFDTRTNSPVGITASGPVAESPTITGVFTKDTRARIDLSPGSPPIFFRDPSNILMAPLARTNGLIFPYTPTINVSHSAEYESQALPHTNYAHHSYIRSNVDQIQVVGEFTAETQDEALYLLAAIQFLKSATKMFYGQDDNRGTPPPVLRFSAHGQQMFNSLPVVLTNTVFDFQNNVDYITVQLGGGRTTNVPTQMQLNATLLVIQSRTRTLDFSLKAYSRGELIGDQLRKGGFA